MDLVAQEARYKNIYQTASNTKDNLKRRMKRADEEAALAQNQVGPGRLRIAARPQDSQA